MSLLSEIKELHISQILIIIIIATTMPFFYLDIYFLKNSLFTSSPLQIPIIISFCMSVCWYGIGLLLFWNSPYRKKEDIQLKNLTQLYILVFALTWLVLISGICIYFQLTLRTFFHICIGVTVFRFILNKWFLKYI